MYIGMTLLVRYKKNADIVQVALLPTPQFSKKGGIPLGRIKGAVKKISDHMVFAVHNPKVIRR